MLPPPSRTPNQPILTLAGPARRRWGALVRAFRLLRKSLLHNPDKTHPPIGELELEPPSLLHFWTVISDFVTG